MGHQDPQQERIKGGYYLLSEAQVNSILDLRLYQLTGLEQGKSRPSTRVAG
ncbi:MAG: hypothetical protein Ct9H300mP32_0250 [Verrucomicrobiota bacterium]|nr:MAG: hypothetical protein Ct9H300mP32_0250 [Verrucomicrobiota bacterium]